MDEEGGAAIDAGAQHAQAFVRGVPGFHHDVIQFVAQEVFDYALVARLHFEEVGKHANRGEASVHDAGLKEAANGLGGISVLGDDRIEGAFPAERGRVLGAENVEVRLATSFFEFFLFKETPQLADLFSDAAHALSDTLKFEGELAALPSEGVDLSVCVGNLGLKTAGVAVGTGQTFFGLRELITQARRGGDSVENCDARFFLLALDLGETGSGGSGVLLAEGERALRGAQVGSGGFENLTVGFAFGFEGGEAVTSLCQFGLVGGDPNQQLGAALFVVAPSGVGAVDFEGDLADAVTVVAQFGVDGIATLRAFGVFGFE